MNKVEGIAATDRLWVITHTHGGGVSPYLVRCDDEPTEEDAVAVLTESFEPDKGDVIDIAEIEDILTIPPVVEGRWALYSEVAGSFWCSVTGWVDDLMEASWYSEAEFNEMGDEAMPAGSEWVQVVQ